MSEFAWIPPGTVGAVDKKDEKKDYTWWWILGAVAVGAVMLKSSSGYRSNPVGKPGDKDGDTELFFVDFHAVPEKVTASDLKDRDLGGYFRTAKDLREEQIREAPEKFLQGKKLYAYEEVWTTEETDISVFYFTFADSKTEARRKFGGREGVDYVGYSEHGERISPW